VGVTDELAQRTTESSGPAAAGGGAAIVPEAVRTSASEPDLTDPSLYFNRELSWLDFNDRVLQLAEDPRVPLLERVNFSAI
jgi:polyphosphate kinase